VFSLRARTILEGLLLACLFFFYPRLYLLTRGSHLLVRGLGLLFYFTVNTITAHWYPFSVSTS